MIDKSIEKKIKCQPGYLLTEVNNLKEQGAELLTIECQRETEEELILDYTFDVDGVNIILRTRTDEESISSLYSLFPCSDYPEREIAAIFQIKFLGNPNLSSVSYPDTEDIK